MNLQTERIDNHRAQLTIEIEVDQLEDAKRNAARKISRQVSIKGFRKGKAPYGLVAQHVGEGTILEEAVEALGDVLYKRALDESDLVPYGPGAFDDFQLEPAPTFIFSVPLQPEVDLKNYLDVRIDFENPTVSDDEVNQALKQMALRAVEVLDDSADIAAAGNRVTIAVTSEFVDGESADDAVDDVAESEGEDALTTEDNSADSRQADTESPPYVPKKGDNFVNDENAIIILDPNEDPFTHGFVEHLIGATKGSDVEFELTIPDDDADETIIGRRVKFLVTMKSIEAIRIPELDDEFALRVSRNRGDEQQDLADLRAATREDLERAALTESKSKYSNQVLEAIVDGACIDYPEMMLDEQIDGMIGEFERNLAQQRISLDDYYRLTSSTKDDLRDQHRESAAQSLRHTLVLREIVRAHEIDISDEDIETRMDAVTAGYGSSPEIRKLFDTPQMRSNIRNELVMNQVNEHIVSIGRGAEPAKAIEALRAQMAADAQRGRERRERLQRYQSEDESAAAELADEEPVGSDSEDSSEERVALPNDGVTNDTINAERT